MKIYSINSTVKNSQYNYYNAPVFMSVKTKMVKNMQNCSLEQVLRNENFDKFLKTHNFSQYLKSGIPLAYSRKDFIAKIMEVLNSSAEPEKLLAKFNMFMGSDDIDGIPSTNDIEPRNIEELQIKNEVDKFYYDNESNLNSTVEKKVMDSLIKVFPEICMTIGKPQHMTHNYSVDIHSLKVLQNSMNNPLYEELSDDSKFILKMTALMHDFGKKGNVITTGHAIPSRKYAEKLLENYNVSAKLKERILNQIENHHWFESFNQGFMDVKTFKTIFSNQEDRKIAVLLAKGDFESVHPYFHLKRMTGTILTPEKYEEVFQEKVAELTK